MCEKLCTLHIPRLSCRRLWEQLKPFVLRLHFEEREAPCKYLQLNFRRVQKDKAVLLRLKEADVQARCRLSLPRLL